MTILFALTIYLSAIPLLCYAVITCVVLTPPHIDCKVRRAWLAKRKRRRMVIRLCMPWRHWDCQLASVVCRQDLGYHLQARRQAEGGAVISLVDVGEDEVVQHHTVSTPKVPEEAVGQVCHERRRQDRRPCKEAAGQAGLESEADTEPESESEDGRMADIQAQPKAHWYRWQKSVSAESVNM